MTAPVADPSSAPAHPPAPASLPGGGTAPGRWTRIATGPGAASPPGRAQAGTGTAGRTGTTTGTPGTPGTTDTSTGTTGVTTGTPRTTRGTTTGTIGTTGGTAGTAGTTGGTNGTAGAPRGATTGRRTATPESDTPAPGPAPALALSPAREANAPAPPLQPGAPTPTLTADGAYAARLAQRGGCWFPERWTLDSAEPYAVPLPANQPEEPGTRVLPMADGRVLVHRRAAGRHLFSLLYPTGPGTGEVQLGGVECDGAELTLLPPAPRGAYAYALAAGPHSTTVWLVAGGAFGPEHLAEIPGRCTGGVWLDRTNRMLALDRDLDGRTKTVAVDLERGGEVTPLLQIADDSDDRLLLADADSGLLLIRSDAPGETRLGWGVLGSSLPVRFPECLRMPGRAVTPFAIQPGQVLMPESCAVALRVDDGSGDSAPLLCGWRPADRLVHQLPTPAGWLAGAGRCTRDGVLELPYVTGSVPCGMARVAVPAPAPGAAASTEVKEAGDAPRAARPVPLQQAPLGGRGAVG